MSEEIRDLALRATQGGAQGFFDLLEEHVVCDNRGHPRPDVAEVIFGREAVIRGYTTWWGTFEEYSVEAEDITDLGRTAVVRIKERGRGKGSGIPFETEITQVWTFRRGQIIHIELFRDHDEALKAAGL
ncbi:MAG: nuclear transport factor 2 family protein [Actinomycetota bacterium]|nr:nuclear transport factor 2 family protein [Actinomycetota bacterium]